MLTASPTLDACTTDEVAFPWAARMLADLVADVAGDPECGFRLAGGDLHVCTDRDGAVVGASDKACFAWARHQLRSARLCGECDNGTIAGETLAGMYFPPERCTACAGSGVAFPEAPADDVDVADAPGDHVGALPAAPAGPDNKIYGFECGDPAFHTHPGREMHHHAPGPAGHHHVGDTVVYAEVAA